MKAGQAPRYTDFFGMTAQLRMAQLCWRFSI